MPTFTVHQIAELVDGTLRGDTTKPITALAMIEDAQPGTLTFVGDPAFAKRWADCRASAALVSADIDLTPGQDQALIVVGNADLAMARVLEAFTPTDPRPATGIHPTAQVHPDANIGKDAAIGPGCVVGQGATLGDRAALHSHAHVFEHATLGDDCVLWPGAIIRERCVLGHRCVLHSHVVIGTDGFGYRPDRRPDGQPTLRKIPHLGHVIIGDDCEIGACTCIDKGKFAPTTLGHDVKIDNHVQIGHNCRIGNLVVISGCSAIAGSCVLGDGVMLGGLAAISDHITVGAGAKLAGGIQLIHDVPPGEQWAGSPGKPFKTTAREKVALAKLPEVMKQVKKMMKD